MTEAAARSERGVVLVTGGARRIGRAICLKLAQAGFDVAIHHHASGDDARSLADEIAKATARAQRRAARAAARAANAAAAAATVTPAAAARAIP